MEAVQYKRPTWSNSAEFILSCMGYCIGLANLWRFPYLCMRNGGGAFLIPYFASVILCGMPLFLFELSIGQFSSCSATKVWNICPILKGVGWGMVAVSGITSIYYNVVITWVLYYLYHSFTTTLPWASCNNTWNTPACFDNLKPNIQANAENESFFQNSSNTHLGNISMLPSDVSLPKTQPRSVSAAEEYWERGVLELSSSIVDTGKIKPELFFFLVVSWIIVFACLFNGIKSSGKVVYVTVTMPYIFLLILLIRGITLPGSLDGIKYYIIPDFSRLLDFKVWAEASLQVFWSLGPGWGGTITMASYNKFNNNVYRDAMFVPIANSLTSFFGGFVIFSVIGFMAHEAELPVDEVVKSGPGLVFIVYPEALTKLPVAPVWTIFFFIMLLTLGIDSQFGMFETMISGLLDNFPNLQKRKTLLVGTMSVLMLLLGLPLVTNGGMYVFLLLDWYVGSFAVMSMALIECLILAWLYGHERLCYDIEYMVGFKPSIWWKICLCTVTPALLVIITIYNLMAMGEPYYGSYTYPDWAIAIGWCLAVVSLVPIPSYFIYELVKRKGTFLQRIKSGIQPSENWGPLKIEDRINYKYAREYIQQKALITENDETQI